MNFRDNPLIIHNDCPYQVTTVSGIRFGCGCFREQDIGKKITGSIIMITGSILIILLKNSDQEKIAF